MKILICLGVAMLVIFATGATLSANSDDGSALTLERALILTAENSPHLKAGAQRVSIAENRRRQHPGCALAWNACPGTSIQYWSNLNEEPFIQFP